MRYSAYRQVLYNMRTVRDLVSVHLNRQEATSLLKEVSEACEILSVDGIMIMPPNGNNVLSHGYQLHVKADFEDEHLESAKLIVRKYKL